MDKYIYVKSSESDEFFANNKVYSFKVQLDYPLTLPGTWKVALLEFHATETSKSIIKADEALYIYTNLVEESIVNGKRRPLLRRLEKNSKAKWDFVFDNPFYVKLAKPEIREFQIYIKKEDGTDAAELVKPVYLTLHVKPYPFL